MDEAQVKALIEAATAPLTSRLNSLETQLAQGTARLNALEATTTQPQPSKDANLNDRVAELERRAGVPPVDPSSGPEAAKRREALLRGEPVDPVIPPTRTIGGVMPA